MSKVEEKVIIEIRKRSELGENKYGVTMERKDLSVFDWLQHAQEEAMDLSIYLQKVKDEMLYCEPSKEVKKHFEDNLPFTPNKATRQELLDAIHELL